MNPTTDSPSEPIRFEGIPPHRFSGSRSRTRRFLTQFNQFMDMNDGAAITMNPLRRCAYFLSPIKGPDVESWIEPSYDRLNRIRSLPPLPSITARGLLESDFLYSSITPSENKPWTT